MAKVLGGVLLTAALLVVSCSGDGGSATSRSSPDRTTTTSGPSEASQTPTTFTSGTYGYTVTLPARWTAIQAQKAWNGKSAISSDSPEVDQFVGTYNASSWGVATPSTQKLAAYTAALIAQTARDHGDTCPARPEDKQQVTVGGDPGILLAYNCGILINLAAAVHNGVGYTLGFRDPTVTAATDPADRATFLAILESVRFPG